MKNIIVLDLDWTLLRDDKTVSNETIRILLEAKKKENGLNGNCLKKMWLYKIC